MDPVGLPARIGYAVVALPLGGAVGFATAYWAFPTMGKFLMGWEPNADPNKNYMALGWGLAVAFTAFLIALTLPWRRRKRRSGRMRRAILSGAFVLVTSLGFAGLGHAVVYDLAFATWLAYLTAFTFVRYGVLDSARRPATTSSSSSSDDADE